MLGRAAQTEAPKKRWELYRLLGEPMRLRILALVAEDELAIGELADLLRESQPNASRHVQALKRAGLVGVRRQGTRVLVRLDEDAQSDPVVADAVASGHRLCVSDGSLSRLGEIIAARDHVGREFFATKDGVAAESKVSFDTSAHLVALGMLLPQRELAIDVGTGDGRLLEVLAPTFAHVIGIDRSQPQLDAARRRCTGAAYRHVELIQAEYDDESFRKKVAASGGADAVFASRVVHHAPKPGLMVKGLASLLRPKGGALVIVDYASHEDETMREKQADLWLGFEERELRTFASDAGLVDIQAHRVAAATGAPAPDGHLDWQVMVARRA